MNELSLYSKIIRKYHSIFPKKYLADYLDDLTLSEINLVNSDDDIFFGYHDRSPFHSSNDLILSHRRIKKNHLLDVGYFNLENPKEFIPVFYTEAFSRQQGSMLAWDHYKHDDDINFNIIENGIAKNISMNIYSSERTHEFEMPIYCFNRDHSMALSCNFFRLAKMRPGYGIENYISDDILDKDNDGIWMMSKHDYKKKLEVSFKELFESIPKIFHKNSYINHLSFSPDNKYIVWFFISEAGKKRKIFFQGKLLEGNDKIFTLESKNLSSHYCWVGKKEILNINRDNKLNWMYSVYDVESLNRRDLNYKFGFDGHPMRNASSGLTVLDSTPDPKRMQHLLILTKNFQKAYQVGRWHTPTKFSGPERVDLHPRWDKSGTRISIDFPFNGRRSQKIIFLKNKSLASL